MVGDDEKIYSQRDMDEMFLKWEQENLEPLMQELQDLRLAKEKLQDQLRGKGRTVRHHDEQEDVAMGKASVKALVGIVEAVNERTMQDDLNRVLTSLSGDLVKGGKACCRARGSPGRVCCRVP